MNGQEFMEALNELDGDIIETELPKKQRSNGRTLRWVIAAAACLLLIVGSVTAAAEVQKMRLNRINTVDENGLIIRTAVDKIRQKELKGLSDIPERIAEQLASYTPQPSYSSLYVDPCSVIESWPSIEKAVERIGFKGLCVPALPEFPQKTVYPDSIFPTSRYNGSQAVLSISGNREGQILSAEITLDDVNAEPDHINLQTRICLITENYKGNYLVLSSHWLKEYGWETEEQNLTTQNGFDFELVTTNGISGGRQGLDGYVATGCAVYTLHLSYELGQAERAREIMFTWADSIR